MRKTVLDHIGELRKRIITVAVFVILLSIAGIYFSGWFIRILIDNLTTNIAVKFIATTPFEFIAAQIKLGIFIGAILAIPILLYHIARFVRPALKRGERKAVYIALPACIMLFILGFAFAYFIFLKVALVFLGNLALRYGVENYWSIGSFVTTVFLSCIVIGLVFNMPVAAFVLSRIGILRKELLARKRRYVYVLLAIIAAVITPTPDVVTMLLVMVPMILLYEVSMVMVRK
jgi:sec-independent protein translocase protein TatC